jgi:putative nucleotidyltransferase with HDIG domain
VDLRFFNKTVRHEIADRLAPPAPPKARRRLAAVRHAMAWLESRRWFLPVVTVVFLLATLQILASSLPAPRSGLAVLGVLFLTSFLLSALYIYVRFLQPKDVQRARSLLLLGTVILIVLILTRYGLAIIQSLDATSDLPFSALRAALPVPLGGVLIAILFNTRLAFAGSLSLALLTSLMLAAPLPYFIYAFVGSLVGIFSLAGGESRTTFVRAGALVAAGNTYTLVAFALLQGSFDTLAADIVGGLINGAMVAVLGVGLLPLLEHPFERTTVFTLLELSNLNSPILRHLILTAPGTYYHSMTVGTLAEAAAEAVGANALLCRVGAYYHDIGKTTHPSYFIENQLDAISRHDKLAPALSRTIVMAHVKDGIEMAEAYGLPEVLVDLIPQHHGTRLVSYFYHRAKEAADPAHQAVNEADYRYPGPKPQTREAAILMLADAVEAATRTLSEPTLARIQGAVQKIINSIFVDGQLDECDLTLRDLHVIANSFVRILTGIFHQRVEYPSLPVDVRKRTQNGDQPAKPAADGPRRDGMAKKPGAKDPAQPEPADG